MPAGPFILIIEGVATGVGSLVTWFRGARAERRRVVALGASVPVEAAVEGQVQRLTGELSLERLDVEPLVAPFSGRPCAYYELTVAEYESSREWSAGGWAQRHFGWATLDGFELVDDSGRAFVPLRGAEVDLDMDLQVRSKRLSRPSEQLIAFLDELVVNEGVLIANRRRVAICEGVLEPGERVSVEGLCRWEAAPAAYRGVERRLVVQGASAGQPLHITDRLADD